MMKHAFLTILICTVAFSCKKESSAISPLSPAGSNSNADPENFTYLALGDSYTIGQGVPLQDNFPNQAVNLLKKDNLFGQLKIIATTGWTTADLASGIAHDQNILPAYDIVTLLIGVNNQYHGESPEDYKPAFEALLQKTIALAGNNAKRVIVLSLPDWGVTPFADGRDRAMIATGIDAYNAVNNSLSQQYGVNYIDITPWTREAANDPSLLESFGLHPSAKEYARWAGKLEEIIKEALR